MNDQIFIQHRFSIERDGKTLQDAICLPQEEYSKLSESEIESIKEERFNKWKELVENPVSEEIPVENQIEVLKKKL